MMEPDLWVLYGLMLRSRLFEEAVTRLWNDGLISGEMHLGTGEEAIAAGVVSQLRDGDAMALDHRGTPPLLMRGVSPVAILREMLGLPGGLCGGRGGHMHMFSRAHLAASSGIVGAAGPMAAGFALSARSLRPGALAVAFFGEGAMNAGMMMESMNLAAAWNLPVLFVCKDDRWSITTESSAMTGGQLGDRANGLGIPAAKADGRDVVRVWEAARAAMERARSGGGPTFLHAQCVHLEGHFLGYQLLRMTRNPLREMPAVAIPLTRSLLGQGTASLGERLSGLRQVAATLLSTLRDPRGVSENDPLARARAALASAAPATGALASAAPRLEEMEDAIGREIEGILSDSLRERAS
jgi:acetoin:2,6-dichlorophenolindophenol oxidoreductase subunit alpha